ncbi:MAG TPA: hypothetical protein VNA25_02855, partial [Phycisphaerae bacterium]|nr:hypothetical protein [Phycisphaerae bacterium]
DYDALRAQLEANQLVIAAAKRLACAVADWFDTHEDSLPESEALENLVIADADLQTLLHGPAVGVDLVADLHAKVEAKDAELKQAKADRDEMMCGLDDLQCRIASALGWERDNPKGLQFDGEVREVVAANKALEAKVARLREALQEIHRLGYEWTMREPLEIVTHGGAAHAAPIGTIVQIADGALGEAAEAARKEGE